MLRKKIIREKGIENYGEMPKSLTQRPLHQERSSRAQSVRGPCQDCGQAGLETEEVGAENSMREDASRAPERDCQQGEPNLLGRPHAKAAQLGYLKAVGKRST